MVKVKASKSYLKTEVNIKKKLKPKIIKHLSFKR